MQMHLFTREAGRRNCEIHPRIFGFCSAAPKSRAPCSPGRPRPARKRTHLEEGSRGPGAFRCHSRSFRASTKSRRFWRIKKLCAFCVGFSGAPPFLKGGFLAEAPLGGRQNVAQGGTGVPSMRLSSARNSRGKKSRTCWGGGTLGTFGEFIQAPSGATLIKRVWHRHYCRCSRLFSVN
jgi:hypothetical protein